MVPHARRRLFWVALSVLILAGVGWLMFSSRDSEDGDSGDHRTGELHRQPGGLQRVLIEIDYITKLPSVTDAGDSRTLAGEYEKTGFEADVREQFAEGDPNICWKEQELDGLVKTLGDDGLNREGAWYMHGLVVPCCDAGSFTGHGCGGLNGLIWLSQEKMREQFVLYSNKLKTPGHRLKAAMHESGHVLNLHHSEYSGEDDLFWKGTFGAVSRKHLEESDRKHVMPGPDGDPWCAMTPDHPVHKEGLNECARHSPPATLASVRMNVRPEKPLYFPGEPITVDVTLTPDPGQTLRYLSERSLSPALGHLRLWAADTPAGPFELLATPTIADADLDVEPLAAGISTTGLHLWPGNRALDRTFWMKATFAGFENPVDVASSDPVEVRLVDTSVETTTLFVPGALNAAAGEESQLFTRLLGGDHLQQGLSGMRAIAQNFPDTVYAPYANLSLGALLAEPFKTVENGVVKTRKPDLAKARALLEEAERRQEVLPRSYRVVLHEMLGRVYVGLAQAASDVEEQNFHYGRACGDFLALVASSGPAPAPGPATLMLPPGVSPSLKDREAEARAQTAIKMIEDHLHKRCKDIASN